MKKVIWGIVGLIVVLLVVVVVGLFNLDGIIRRTVESQSETQLQLPAELQAADFSIFGGTLHLRGYQIGSPEGFSSPAMFSMDDINVAVSYGQLREDPVRIQAISIDTPTLVIEYAQQKFNYQILIDNASKPAPSTTGDEDPLRLIIDQLSIDDATVVLRLAGLKTEPLAGAIDLSELPIEDEYRLTLPPLRMQNIGTADGADNGAAIQEVLMQVVAALTASAAESEQLPRELRAILSGNLEDVMQAVGDEARRQLDKALEDIDGEAGKILQDVLRGASEGENGQNTDSGDAVEQRLQRGIEEGIGIFRDGSQNQPRQTPEGDPQAPQPEDSGR